MTRQRRKTRLGAQGALIAFDSRGHRSLDRDDRLVWLYARGHTYEAPYRGGLNLLELFEVAENGSVRAFRPRSPPSAAAAVSLASRVGLDPWARNQSPYAAPDPMRSGSPSRSIPKALVPARGGCSLERWPSNFEPTPTLTFGQFNANTRKEVVRLFKVRGAVGGW
jgi:hypothetical protein